MKITQLAAGRRFADAIPDGECFRLRFLDGFEIQCAWGSQGPEVRAYAQGIISSEVAMHPQFQYVRGKTVNKLTTNGQSLIIHFTDGHELRSSFRGTEPKVEGVDVKVTLDHRVLL